MDNRAADYKLAHQKPAPMKTMRASHASFGMALHNQALAAQEQRHASIYYCTTGQELPEFEPCRDRKDQTAI